MLVDDKGQKTEQWANFWKGLTPESEIQMWDYYGLRQWILKYTPRYGQVIEAGCGLGRYVFYLNSLGINIEGLDFEQDTIEYLNSWKDKHGFNHVPFINGDVQNLPYETSSLSGYISLGVVEHFIEGPQRPIQEAFRAMRPGGIAIITTPSISWFLWYRDTFIGGIKSLLRKVLRRKNSTQEFFQYWYKPRKLKKFVEESGLFVTRSAGADLLYPFVEATNFKVSHWTEKSLPIRISNRFEGTWISNFGAQSITISVKVADIMHCFLCGKLSAERDSLNEYDVPICDTCDSSELADFYNNKRKVMYHAPYKVFPPLKDQVGERCELSGDTYKSDRIFEDFGFTKKISPEYLSIPRNNIKLANTSVQPIFRMRKS